MLQLPIQDKAKRQIDDPRARTDLFESMDIDSRMMAM